MASSAVHGTGNQRAFGADTASYLNVWRMAKLAQHISTAAFCFSDRRPVASLITRRDRAVFPVIHNLIRSVIRVRLGLGISVTPREFASGLAAL